MPTKTTTVVKNISGKTLTFSFLPPFGKELDNNETYEIPGDIYALLSDRPRRLRAFQDALTSNLLELIQIPSDPAGGEQYRPPLQTIVELRAIVVADRSDKDLRLVEDKGSTYRFDATGVGSDDGDLIIVPDAGTGRWFKTPTPGAAPVDSVFGRTGAVAAAASDYDASEVDNDSGVPGAQVDDALDNLDARHFSTIALPFVTALVGPSSSLDVDFSPIVAALLRAGVKLFKITRIVVVPSTALSSYDIDFFRSDAFGGTSFYNFAGIALGLTPQEDFGFSLPDDDASGECHLRFTNGDGALSATLSVGFEGLFFR